MCCAVSVILAEGPVKRRFNGHYSFQDSFIIADYAANKPEDSDRVVLPVASFDVYFGTTSFGRKYLRLIPGEILERADSGFGICRYRVQEEYRINYHLSR